MSYEKTFWLETISTTVCGFLWQKHSVVSQKIFFAKPLVEHGVVFSYVMITTVHTLILWTNKVCVVL